MAKGDKAEKRSTKVVTRDRKERIYTDRHGQTVAICGRRRYFMRRTETGEQVIRPAWRIKKMISKETRDNRLERDIDLGGKGNRFKTSTAIRRAFRREIQQEDDVMAEI